MLTLLSSEHMYLTYVHFIVREHFRFYETSSIKAHNVRSNHVKFAVKHKL